MGTQAVVSVTVGGRTAAKVVCVHNGKPFLSSPCLRCKIPFSNWEAR